MNTDDMINKLLSEAFKKFLENTEKVLGEFDQDEFDKIANEIFENEQLETFVRGMIANIMVCVQRCKTDEAWTLAVTLVTAFYILGRKGGKVCLN